MGSGIQSAIEKKKNKDLFVLNNQKRKTAQMNAVQDALHFSRQVTVQEFDYRTDEHKESDDVR